MVEEIIFQLQKFYQKIMKRKLKGYFITNEQLSIKLSNAHRIKELIKEKLIQILKNSKFQLSHAMRHCPVTTLGIMRLKGLPNLYRNIVNSWLKKLPIRIFESLTSDKEEFQLDMKKMSFYCNSWYSSYVKNLDLLEFQNKRMIFSLLLYPTV